MSGLKDPSNAQAPVFREDLNKIEKTGIWKDKDPQFSGGSDPSFIERRLRGVSLQACRYSMAAAWITTGAVVVGLACIAPAGLIVYAPAAIALNWGVQKGLGWLHNHKFETLFAELKSESKGAGSLQAGIAWAGVMHEFLDKQNPLLILPNRSKLTNFYDATSIESVKRQLRQAAQYAADKLEKNNGSDSQPFLKDPFFNDMLSQNERVLEDFAKRCVGFPKESASYTNPWNLFKKFWYGKS